ncbi:MAG: site-specific integrase [Deltaproteobacteria bacterium]|jgi:integrase|nr:site-specific integrase [Deltaproteobacteria bacterium]
MKRYSTKFEGVFYRERRTLFNGRPDRTFEFCYSEQGRKRWKLVGRASEGYDAVMACQARLDMLRELKNPQAQLRPLTVGEALDAWLERRKAESRTCRPCLSAVEQHLRPRLGQLTVAELTPEVLDRLRTDLLKRYAVHYVRKVLSHLRAAIALAVRNRRHVGINPVTQAAGFVFPTGGRRCERFLTPAEAVKLLAELSARAPLWRDLALVSLHTGARLTELYKLRVQDLQPGSMAAVITSKLGTREPLQLTADALAVLATRAAGRAPGELIFPDARRSSRQFARTVERCGLNAGVVDKTHRVWFHTLRHTFASWLVQGGTDFYAVQKLMRHGSAAMTQRYAHLHPETFRRHLDVIGMTLATSTSQCARNPAGQAFAPLNQAPSAPSAPSVLPANPAPPVPPAHPPRPDLAAPDVASSPPAFGVFSQSVMSARYARPAKFGRPAAGLSARLGWRPAPPPA